MREFTWRIYGILSDSRLTQGMVCMSRNDCPRDEWVRMKPGRELVRTLSSANLIVTEHFTIQHKVLRPKML